MSKFKPHGILYILSGRGGEMSRHSTLTAAKAAARADAPCSLKWKHAHSSNRNAYDSDGDYSILVVGAAPPVFADDTPHPTYECDKAMRKTLLADLDAFGDGNGRPIESDWRSATRDAGAVFPSVAALQTDDWGDWLYLVTEHVHGNDGDLETYFFDKYSRCPSCGHSMSKGRGKHR